MRFGIFPYPFRLWTPWGAHIGGRAEGFVFATRNGTPWNTDILVKRHLRKLNAGGHLHMFRHTFATRQLHAGVPLSVVSKLLGHGSISTTLNIYAHVLAEHLQQLEQQRARILGTKWAPKPAEVAEEKQVA
jgi:integrase